MKKIIISIFALFIAKTAYSSVEIQKSIDEVRDPSTLLVVDPQNYEAKGATINGHTFQGRNIKIVKYQNHRQISDSENTLIGTDVKRASSKLAQYENLESVAGEMVDKLESDRMKRMKIYRNGYQSSKENLEITYDNLKKIDLDNIGKEVDPTVKEEFKCVNLNNCDVEEISKAVKKCDGSKMLRWTGSNWTCVAIFGS